ncbi:hypothetical protein AB0F17_43440 [Nonomuraea sp. NPDC026600]|uniref:hypothetical protein n=1 Tax=Nonomuraea sp. NPDC026600 TaxID=3155363 RepID=UPI0033C91A4C
MIDIVGFDPLRDVAPPYWAAAGASALALLLGLFRMLRRWVFPMRAQQERPRRSLADAVTWACASAALVFAGEGMFEVITRAAPGVRWLPWLGIGLLEGPLLAFALRAKELIGQKRHIEAGQATRMTWLLASASAVISASAALDTGTPSIPLLRAAAPIVGVILWHHALRIEQEANGSRRRRESRWVWTPEYILTRLGLVTARATETADAEVHQRLTRVADWVIRYARSVKRNADRNGWWDTRWNTYIRLRMERIYRAAERDLDLTRNADRRALLEQIIVSRSDAVLLTTLAGVTRADLGLSEAEQPLGQPERNTRIVFHKPVEQAVRNTRILFHKEIVEQPVERPSRPIRIVFQKPVERPAGNDRNAPETGHRATSGTAERNSRNGGSGTPDQNGGTPNRNTGAGDRNSDGKPTRKEIYDAIADAITPTGEVPIRPLATQLGIPTATMHRHVAKYREEHRQTSPPKEVIPPPRANGHQLTTVGGGDID